MCVDYSNLNHTCPKDTFPLPRNNQIVDAAAGHQLLSFLDAYTCYNQIPMYPPDSEHTTFITPTGMYCYNVMPFGLKNVGATYQGMMSHVLKPLLGDNHGRVYGQHVSQVQASGRSFSTFARGIQVYEKAPVSAKPREMCIWGRI